jgi:hypothetical protein
MLTDEFKILTSKNILPGELHTFVVIFIALVCEPTFHCCDKIFEINILKGGNVYFDSHFQGSNSESAISAAFMRVVREHHSVGCM